MGDIPRLLDALSRITALVDEENSYGNEWVIIGPEGHHLTYDEALALAVKHAKETLVEIGGEHHLQAERVHLTREQMLKDHTN